jgi:cell division septation protein DedD
MKADVSHRIRRRRPSIFGTRWMRVILVGGLVVAVGLAVGPLLAGRLREDLPRAVSRVTPWSGTRGGEAAPDEAGRGLAGADPTPAEAPAAAPAAKAGGGLAPAPPPPALAAASAGGPAGSGAGGAAARYRIQVGAFLDHRNADRLVERLRDSGFGASTVVQSQARARYQVVAVPGAEAPAGDARAGEDPGAALARRLQVLGLPLRPVDGGVAVADPVPLAEAQDLARRLREDGVSVRLWQDETAGVFRVVRVGEFAARGQAEEVLAALGARGFEGIVVRER